MNAILKIVQKRKVQIPISNTPTIPHDCDTCEYLGNVEMGGVFWELYFHPADTMSRHADILTTFIARYGKDEKYISGLDGITRHPILALAFARKIVSDYTK